MRARVWVVVVFVCALVVLSGCGTIGVPDKAPVVGTPFTMIIASDPQYPWWDQLPCNGCSKADCDAGRCDAAICSAKDDGARRNAINECEKRMGRASVRDQIRAAAKVTDLTWPQSLGGGKVTSPAGLIVNGDLTAYFHKFQVEEENRIVAEELEKIRKENPSHPILSVVPFLGLGNHDYRNNVCDCRSYSPWDYNVCARMAGHLMYELYSNKSWIAFDRCSFAYAWKFNRIRFVQMHLYPGYKADFQYWLSDPQGCRTAKHRFDPAAREPGACDDGTVFPSWSFLETTLAAGDAAGDRSVLLFHDPDEYWSAADVQKFREIVRKYDVVAVFAGHQHERWGVQNGFPIANGLVNKRGGSVPVILSGAAEMRTFVLAEFGDNSMRAAVISTQPAGPSYQEPTATNPTPQVRVTW